MSKKLTAAPEPNVAHYLGELEDPIRKVRLMTSLLTEMAIAADSDHANNAEALWGMMEALKANHEELAEAWQRAVREAHNAG